MHSIYFADEQVELPDLVDGDVSMGVAKGCS
jgi:hypothetical protein